MMTGSGEAVGVGEPVGRGVECDAEGRAGAPWATEAHALNARTRTGAIRRFTRTHTVARGFYECPADESIRRVLMFLAHPAPADGEVAIPTLVSYQLPLDPRSDRGAADG